MSGFEGVPGAIGEVRAMTTAAGGSSLSTSAIFVEIPDGAAYLDLLCTTFSTAIVVKMTKCPYLLILKATDQLATAAKTTDYTVAAQNALTTPVVDLSALDTAANKNFLYMGAAQPFRGVTMVHDNANNVGSVLTVKYWNGTAWTAVASLTDGTASGGDTFAQDGNVTWTVPTDWATGTLAAIEGAGLVPQAAMMGVFWTRWEVSVKLAATVKFSKMMGMNRNTNYMELPKGSADVIPWFEKVFKGLGGFSGIEVLTDAGTAKIEGNVASLAGFGFANNS